MKAIESMLMLFLFCISVDSPNMSWELSSGHPINYFPVDFSTTKEKFEKSFYVDDFIDDFIDDCVV